MYPDHQHDASDTDVMQLEAIRAQIEVLMREGDEVALRIRQRKSSATP